MSILKYLIEFKIAERTGNYLVESGTSVSAVTGRFQAVFTHDFRSARKSSTIDTFSDAERFAKRAARRLLGIGIDNIEYRVVAATEKATAAFDWQTEVRAA